MRNLTFTPVVGRMIKVDGVYADSYASSTTHRMRITEVDEVNGSFTAVTDEGRESLFCLTPNRRKYHSSVFGYADVTKCRSCGQSADDCACGEKSQIHLETVEELKDLEVAVNRKLAAGAEKGSLPLEVRFSFHRFRRARICGRAYVGEVETDFRHLKSAQQLSLELAVEQVTYEQGIDHQEVKLFDFDKWNE